MGFKYKVSNNGIYFMTVTVIDWIDVFTRKELAEIVIESLKYCQKEKGLVLYAWCLMPSHLHLIASAEENTKLSDILRDFKKFTSKSIVAVIKEINESRKEWLLDKFEFAGRTNFKNKEYKFWQDGFHPIELDTNAMMGQKLDYLHYNPVAAGIVYEPEHYVYSSAINYAGQQGLIMFC
ncbi:REP-associated tyrosine transposase [Mucilaginibacter arboris]|uniref:Transposase n=1 Tax=Mucilaginibacter arboris TaxID=2682090 RepID=A0A7K1SXT3_9SPHI|nr:transposase [Mucilaginibacter arboris]MVN22058.1 transposase [Mucilaginibacter arboris]